MLKSFARTVRFVFKAAPYLSIFLFLCLIVQGIVPIVVTTSISEFIDKVSDFSNLKDVIPFLIPLLIFLILDSIAGPLVIMFQGELTDRVSLSLNDKLHETIDSINSLNVLEDPNTYHKLELLRAEISFRPVNLLVYSLSLFRMSITIIIILIQLAQFSFIIPIVLLLSLIPQSVFLYKLQVEAFENTVFRSPLARRLQYFSEVLLKRDYAKERLVYRFSKFVSGKYNDTFNSIYRASRRDRRKITLASELIAVGSVIAIIALTLYFFKQVFIGIFTLGSLAMFMQYLRLAGSYSFQFIQEGALLMDTLLFMDKYFSFIDDDSNLEDGELDISSIENIEFRNVSFIYPGRDNYALKDINFSIDAPQKVAVVGINGSGKTTLLKLVLRLYDVTKGEILVNGRNIKDYKINSLRKCFGVLFQDFNRYSWKACENIKIADTTKVDEKYYMECLNLSGAKEVMEELPKKDDTYLGKLYDDGVELSGGQWQKIATARAFYRKSSARIFDEPSSALDPISEKNLWLRLLNWSDGKLTIFTSHRLYGLKNADYFIVLNKGSLTEKGTFDEIYIEGTHFKEIYDAQAGEKEIN